MECIRTMCLTKPPEDRVVQDEWWRCMAATENGGWKPGRCSIFLFIVISEKANLLVLDTGIRDSGKNRWFEARRRRHRQASQIGILDFDFLVLSPLFLNTFFPFSWSSSGLRHGNRYYRDVVGVCFPPHHHYHINQHSTFLHCSLCLVRRLMIGGMFSGVLDLLKTCLISPYYRVVRSLTSRVDLADACARSIAFSFLFSTQGKL